MRIFRPVDSIRFVFPYTAHVSRYDRPSHQVYCTFFFRKGWQVQFCESDLMAPLPRQWPPSREILARGRSSMMLATWTRSPQGLSATEYGRGCRRRRVDCCAGQAATLRL
jgi:hypothetical protein